VDQKVILVLHDFGSLFGFNWAHKHSDRVAGLIFMEYLYNFPDWYATNTDGAFMTKLGHSTESMRKAILDDNIFIEDFIQAQIVRNLTKEEMDHYRAPFLTPEDRITLFEFAMLMPVKDFSPVSYEAAEQDQAWLAETDLPKLYFWADPGKIEPPELAKDVSSRLKNITSVGVGHAKHFLQEDHPQLIGEEINKWLHHQGPWPQ
jgi:haloalkane dehalogenase